MTTSLFTSHCKSWVETNSFHGLAARNQRPAPPCISWHSEVVLHSFSTSGCAHGGCRCCLCSGALPDWRDQAESTPTHGLGTNHSRILVMKPEERGSPSKEQFTACALNLGSCGACFQTALSLQRQQPKCAAISFPAPLLTRGVPHSINKTDLSCLQFASPLSFWPRSNTVIWWA